MTNIYLNLINIVSHIIHRVEGYDGALIPIIIFVVVITGKKSCIICYLNRLLLIMIIIMNKC